MRLCWYCDSDLLVRIDEGVCCARCLRLQAEVRS